MTDEQGQRLGHSVAAAKQGIFQVVVSRICMAIPAMGEAGVARWGMGGSKRRGCHYPGGLRTLGGVGGAAKGDRPFLRVLTFTLLTPSLLALLSPQPFPP